MIPKINNKFSKYLTMKIHTRLYRYIRLPFGLNGRIGNILAIIGAIIFNCDFTTPYLNDILIKSNSQDRHMEHIKEVSKEIEK